MKNDYEIRGTVTAIFLNSPKFGSMETLISTEKLKRAQEFPNTWRPVWDKCTQGFYCMGTLNRKIILLHRWIFECPTGMHVDHINNKTLDNVDQNLRIVTNAQNQQNRSGAQRNSKSGILGVCLAQGKWRAQLQVNGKKNYLGVFDTREEAERAVKIGRAKFMAFSKESREGPDL